MNIKLKSVAELLDMNFFIPDYQRGYRWTQEQVKDLLDDINDFAKKSEKKKYEFYCLQPLVVRKMSAEAKSRQCLDESKKWYEVIDGQQRLTTIYLILAYLNDALNILGLPTNTYILKYQRETNEKSDYLCNRSNLETIDDETVDHYYMTSAYQTIKNWFERLKVNKGDFSNALLKHEPECLNGVNKDKANNVRFIWYESENENPISVFSRLNIGKISLTNAELIKALFLNRSNFVGTNTEEQIQLRQQEIASEWDNIEYTLQDEEFWLFLHDKSYSNPTRIDIIFNLICQNDKLNIKEKVNASGRDYDSVIGEDTYKTFRYFYEYFNSNGADIKECWAKVKKYYATFNEWYHDLVLYHYIGYLIECKHDVEKLVNEWDSSPTKEAFVKGLKKKIKSELDKCPKPDYVYGNDRGKCKPILLFHNIQTVINQNSKQQENEKYKLGAFYKFPFHLYKLEGWDVEHINSNTENEEEDENTHKEWLVNIYMGVDEKTQEKIKTYFNEKDDDTKKVLYDEIRKSIPDDNSGWTDEDKNKVKNFALLDFGTNRSYGNTIFSGKRRWIIGKDRGRKIPIPSIKKDGSIDWGQEETAISSFVPPCTKQVFMKYYSSVIGNSNYWLPSDADNYLKDIEECIKQLTEQTKEEK